MRSRAALVARITEDGQSLKIVRAEGFADNVMSKWGRSHYLRRARWGRWCSAPNVWQVLIVEQFRPKRDTRRLPLPRQRPETRWKTL